MDRRDRGLERWLARRVGNDPLAVILGATWNGLSFARSLGRRGIHVLLLDSTRYLGSYTRYARFELLPTAEDHPDEWIRTLELVGSRLDRQAVLMPTDDPDTLLVARHQDTLSSRFRFVVPARERAEQIIDKRSQYAVAAQAGVRLPRTHFPVSAEEVHGLIPDLDFPCILKPLRSHTARQVLGKKLVTVGSGTELVSTYRRLVAAGVPTMIQEVVPGGDRALFGYLAFWDREGREVAWLTKRKLRQSPPGFGDGSLQVTVVAPEVAAVSRRLLRAFHHRGFVGVEYKLSESDGHLYLMEINPRTVSGNQLAIEAGLDFPWIGYRYLSGTLVADGSRRGFRPGVKYLNEELDLHAFLTLRQSSGMTARQWMRSIRGTKARAVSAWDDPLPLMVGLLRSRSLLGSTRPRAGTADSVPDRV